jgi:hypothetical protein
MLKTEDRNQCVCLPWLLAVWMIRFSAMVSMAVHQSIKMEKLSPFKSLQPFWYDSFGWWRIQIMFTAYTVL